MNRAQMLDAYVTKTGFNKTFAEQCKSGRNIRPSYLPGTIGLKDVRTSANQSLPIRCKTRISLTNGRVDGAIAGDLGETRRQRRTREYFEAKNA